MKQLRVYKSVPVLEPVMENKADGSCENTLQEGKHCNKSKASTWRKLSDQPITAVVFLSAHMLVYAAKDHHVCIYNLSEKKVVYDVKLTYRVSALDVWNERYILVGSFPVQLFEMKRDRLRRIVVLDSENNHQLTASSSFLGTFLPNGCFATANEISSEVLFWPSPTEESDIITEAATRLQIKNKPEQIHSMWGSGDSEHPLLVTARKKSRQNLVVDVFDCSDYTHIKEVEMSMLEKVYLSFEQSGRLNLERKYGSPVTTIGRSQSPKAHIPVALDDGTVVLYEGLTAFSTFNSDEHSKIASLVCMEYDGTPMAAAGYENGKLGLWGGKIETRPESDLTKEIFTTQVFLGDSFYRESLLCDYYEFTADFDGGKFENYPSYSLKIPRGAIPKGEKVVITTGIMKYGPCGLCECPDDINIVSPIIWLCSNNPKFQFLKPAILEMQHCCNMAEYLELLKADHDDTNGTHNMLKFQVKKCSRKFTSGNYYLSTDITHFCFYCWGIFSSDHGKSQGFRLIPVERVGYREKTHQVIFCLSYNLGTCQLAVKKQYPSEEYKIGQALPVQFQGDMEVDIDYPRESSGWKIAKKYPGHPIRVEDLNWQQKFPTDQALILAHKNREYLPRFILELCGKDAQRSVTITVNLTNVARPVSYDIILYMPSVEGGQEGMIVHSSSGLSDDSGNGDEQSSLEPTYRRFALNASTDSS